MAGWSCTFSLPKIYDGVTLFNEAGLVLLMQRLVFPSFSGLDLTNPTSNKICMRIRGWHYPWLPEELAYRRRFVKHIWDRQGYSIDLLHYKDMLFVFTQRIMRSLLHFLLSIQMFSPLSAGDAFKRIHTVFPQLKFDRNWTNMHV